MGDSKNPFTDQSYKVEVQHKYTEVPDVSKYPFKTLNRLLDDIKWTVPFRFQCGDISILNLRPIEYSDRLPNVVSTYSSIQPEMLMLNNSMNYYKTVDVVELNEHNENQTLTIIRGLITIGKDQIHHFTLQLLENKSPFFAHRNQNVKKHEYHIIPQSLVSRDDLSQFKHISSENMIDDVYAITSDSDNNHLLRISIFNSEFTDDDIKSLTDASIIKDRFTKAAADKPQLDPNAIPNGSHCTQKLISVLKGPLLMDPLEPLKTIDLAATSLTSMVDLNLLLDKLGFTFANPEKTSISPPNIFEDDKIKESFYRKVLQLIYVGRCLDVEGNTFKSTYSFSDNLSQIFTTFREFDYQVAMTYYHQDNSNEYGELIALSSNRFYQDELIIKCFENSIQSDATNKIFYVDYLKNVIDMRHGSQKLRAYLSSQSRKGELLGYTDYLSSLQNIGISPPDQTPAQLLSISDDYILSIYQSNVKSDFKNYTFFNQSLEKIGRIKQSEEILNFLSDELLPVNLAVRELGIEEITEDDVVLTAYEFKLSEGEGDPATLSKCLKSLAVGRKSFILMSYIEKTIPQILGTYSNFLTYESSLEILDLSQNANEFEVINKFQSKLMDSDIRVLRQAIISLNHYKRSELISKFLEKGEIDPKLLPAENWPAGLDNIGNTCYLNSLLQYYFSIKPIRDMVLNFEDADSDSINGKERKIGGRKIETNETQRASQFIFHLKKLFDEMIHSEERCVAPSKELAFLSFLPASQPVNFLSPNSLPGDNQNPILIESASASLEDVGMKLDLDVLERIEVKDKIVSDSDSIEEIPNPFANQDDNVVMKEVSSSITDSEDVIMDDFVEDISNTKILPINLDDMESTIEIGRQQDVTECIENVNFQIEAALMPEYIEEDGEQYDLIKKLFYGKTNQTITPLNDNSKLRTSVERFSSLIINISDHPKDIYDALDNYFNADTFELEEGLVKKSLTISKLPAILQFQVQRVLFDRERLMAYKSIDPIPFSDELYVDRYLDTDNQDILLKKEEVFSWKSEIKELQAEKLKILTVDEVSKMNVIDSLVTTKKYLDTVKDEYNISEDTITLVDKQIDILQEKVLAIDASIDLLNGKIAAQFSDYKEFGYTIFAVFIHRGEASYGHYWIYIKDPHQKNIYRKYNDEIVTEVPESEVFNFVNGNTATPYYIAYVKKELELDFVEPLKRNISCK